MPTYGIFAKSLNVARAPPPESSDVGSPMGCQSEAAGVLAPSAKYPMTLVTLFLVLATSRPQTGRVVLSPLLWLESEFVGRAFSISRRLNCIVLAAERMAITMREPGSSVSRKVGPPCAQPSPWSVGPLTRRRLTSRSPAIGIARIEPPSPDSQKSAPPTL